MLIASIVAVSVVSDTTDAEAVWYDDFDEAPKVPTNPTEGDVFEVGGQTHSDFSTALNEAIETGQDLILLDNYTHNEELNVEGKLVIDLNKHTLAFKEIEIISTVAGTDADLTIKNGTLYGMDNSDVAKGSIVVNAGSSVTLDSVRYYCEAAALFLKGQGSTVNVVNGSVIHAIGLCIGTNAGEEKNHGVIVNVDGSSLYADKNPDGAQAAILFNVPGNLNITDSTIKGYCQGVIVRGGTAMISGSEIVNEMVTESVDMSRYTNGNWGEGTFVPNGGLVIGNRSGSNTYQYPSDVSLTDTKITCNGEKASGSPAIYAYSNESEGNGIELVYDENCKFTNVAGSDNIVLANEESGNIVAGTPVAKIGDRDFPSLESAIEAAGNGEKIVLVAHIKDCPRITLDDGGDYVLDLNEHTITFAQNAYFLLNNASLNVTGSGTVKEGSPFYSVFMIKNTADATPGNEYIHLTIGENVTAQGWAPVFINSPATSGGNAYGVTVDVYGKLDSVLDTAGAGGHAIYINGQNTSTADYPVINIYDGAKITSKANGVYIAGYTEFNMYGGSITGVNVGIEIRAGILNIEGGSIEATSNTFSTISNGNGSTTSGVAVAVSQHTTALNIDVNITDGNLKGLFALYQASAEKNNDSTKVDLSVTGGTFTSTDTTGQYASVGAEDKTGFITGGIFKNSSGSGDTSLNSGDLLASGFDVGSDGAIILESGEPTVATINGTPYGSINDAINAADPGDTIVLKVDLVLSSEIRITDSNITLDLGRHSISGADDSSRNFNLITIRGDDVTIRNGTLNGSSVTNQIVNVIQATGVKLNGLTIDNSNGNPFGYPIVVNGSEVVLSGSIDLIATFYGINLDQGGSVTEPVKLTFASDSVVDFNSTNGIFAECAGTALVLEEGSQYDSDKSGFVLLHGYDVKVTGSAEYLNENHRWVVTINPDKDGSTVTVTGSDGTAYAAQDDGKYHLPAGEFTVTASTAGYSGSKTMPLEGGVAGGTSTFSVEMSLNAPSVTITKGEQADDGSVTLSAVASHEIGVTYTYQWSDANGSIQGATAATYDAPGPGTYSVSVTASDGTKTSVAEATVTVSAPAPKYDVQIVVTPSDATVTIDGQTVTGTSVQLVAGTYQVVVSKDGYTSVTETIEVGEGLANRIEVHLEAIGPEDPDTPVYPPFNPGGDDDVYVPPTVVVDQSSSDDDEAVKIVACAACAVVAAFLAAVMLFHRRD